MSPACEQEARRNGGCFRLSLRTSSGEFYVLNAGDGHLRTRGGEDDIAGTDTGTKGDRGRTLVQLVNPSPLIVRARVSLNARVYGDLVAAGPLYDGREVWLLFPQQSIQGWFEIESLLQMKGKTVAAMIAETTPANHSQQLTMRLEMEFWDELGTRRKLPARHHYFDFDRWVWIPHIAEQPA